MFLQLAITLFSMGLIAHAQIVDVPGCSSYTAAVATCNSNSGLSGVLASLDWGNSLGFYTQDPALYCATADKTKFTAAVTCVMNAYSACASTDDKTLIPVAAEVVEAIGKICVEHTKFDRSCITAITTCASNAMAAANFTDAPAVNATFADKKGYYCSSTLAKYTADCIAADTKAGTCGSATTMPLYTAVLAELVPSACKPADGGDGESAGSTVVYTSLLMFVSLLISSF